MGESVISNNLTEEFRRIAASDHVSHAYLLEGEHSGELLRTAEEFVRILRVSPADVLYPEQEKPGLIGVDDIREGITKSVHIRPYNGTRKVYIVRDAEKMNPQAQNALLKTLEEPPEYVVILLLTANAGSFLPTILSRCVKLSLLGKETAEKAAGGGPDLTEEILRSADTMDTKVMLDLLSRLVKEKEELKAVPERLRERLRDVLYYKASGDPALIRDRKEEAVIRRLAEEMSYAGIEKVLRMLTRTERRLEANVNAEIATELMLLALREETEEKKR